MNQLSDDAKLQPRTAPPADYYANNLRNLVATVCTQYEDILSESEHRVANAILDLSSDAIRLFARIVSRKGPVYFSDQMKYREVSDTKSALDELAERELIEHNSRVPGDQVLRKLTNLQLVSVFPHVQKVVPKSVYINIVACRYTETRLLEQLNSGISWFTLLVKQELDTFLLLFFGDREQDLSTFVMRDLGITRFEKYALKDEIRQFVNRDELDRYLEWIRFPEYLHTHRHSLAVNRAKELLASIEQPQENRSLEHLRHRLLNELGRIMERQQEWSLALEIYARSGAHPARERTMRILRQCDDLDSIERIRSQILLDPWTKEEENFAKKFLVKSRRTSRQDTNTVELKSVPDISIEEYALEHLTRHGGAGWHFENVLPMSLFGLAYWEWIFTPVPGAFVNPFQSGPRDLYWPEFFEARKALCKDPLTAYDSVSDWIKKVHAEKRGISNHLVHWEAITPEILERLINVLGEASIRKLLTIIRRDLRQMRSGFPDLTLLLSDTEYQFVEVKGPGDQVQRNQEIWIDALADAGLPVQVLRYRMSA